MKKIIVFFFLASCASPNLSVGASNSKLNFDKNLSFDEFNQMLIEYAKVGPYPNIDQ